MMVRLRTRVGVYASAILLLCGLALIAQATEPITRSQAEAMIDSRLAAAGVLVFGAFWVLLLTISGRSERALAASIARLEGAVAEFKKSLDSHDQSLFAHGPASEHNHAPLETKIDKIEDQVEMVEKTLDDFLTFCKTHQCAMGQRDPADSPKPKRKTDSGDDYRALRGKQ